MFKKKKRESAKGAEGNEQTAVVGSGGRRFRLRLHVRKKFLLVVVASIVLLAAGYFAYTQFVSDDEDTTAPATEEQEEGLSRAFQQLDEQEKQKIEDRLAAAETPEEKSAIYIDYANLESGEDNDDAALEYAKQAVDAHESADSLGALAFQAKLAGDYQLAAESYGKAAELIRQAGGENSEYEYEVFMQMKRDAEQQDG